MQPVTEKRGKDKNDYDTFFPPGKWLNLRTKSDEIIKSKKGSF